jgi:FtsZ-binding cell division protein ZapB
MAETTRLSVGQALDKLRGADAPKSKMTQLQEKINSLEQESQRLRAARQQLERGQRAGTTKRD